MEEAEAKESWRMEKKAVRKQVPDPENPGKKVWGEVIGIVRTEEPFSHAELEDGTKLTARLSFTEVVRLDDKWNKDGTPIYNITQNGTLSIAPPEHLMRGGDADA